jgi:hypothetical protein
MAQVIFLQNALHTRTASQPHSSTTDLPGCATPAALADQPELGKEDVDSAILLLEGAARQARLLVVEINDPSRREYFEAQIATIEQLLHLARSMSLKLE